jgi:hypothetical protein
MTPKSAKNFHFAMFTLHFLYRMIEHFMFYISAILGFFMFVFGMAIKKIKQNICVCEKNVVPLQGIWIMNND